MRYSAKCIFPLRANMFSRNATVLDYVQNAIICLQELRPRMSTSGLDAVTCPILFSVETSVCRVGCLRNLVCTMPRQCAFFRYPPIGGSLFRNGAAGVIIESVGLWMLCLQRWYNFVLSTLGI